MRGELENLVEIITDMREQRLAKQRRQKKEDETSADSRSQAPSFNTNVFSQTKNASFLNQELQFYIDNLQQKASASGLDDDALIPKQSEKDKQIY